MEDIGAGRAQLHASCVAVDGQGCLILGPSGTGKSTLALALMALGAGLVADDRTDLTAPGDGRLWAAVSAALAGRIEARGVGILRAAAVGPVPVALAVDLGAAEDQRLPPWRQAAWLGVAVPLVLGPGGPHLAPAILQRLRGGRAA